MPFTIMAEGTVTQPSTAVNQIIQCPSGCDYFKIVNLTQMATTQATGRCVAGEWYGGGLFADNDGLRWKKANGTSAISIDNFSTSTASNGFTFVRSFPQPEAAVVGTAITNANPAVVSMTNTYNEGDTVVLYNTTGMLQIAGQSFTISSVSGSGFTLLGLDASGFANAATAVTARRISPVMPVEPRFLYVTKISQAAQAVVTVSQAHNYVVGQKVIFQIPNGMGMQQLNNINQRVPPVITAVTAYTFTINVNTTGYSAFAYPASSASPTAPLFATVSSAGQSVQFNPVTGVQTGYNFQYVPFHTGLFIPYMSVSAGANSPGGSAGDVLAWQCYKAEAGILNAPVAW